MVAAGIGNTSKFDIFYVKFDVEMCKNKCCKKKTNDITCTSEKGIYNMTIG